ncbi:MAG: cytochrome c [Acidobacteriota bacterium]
MRVTTVFVAAALALGASLSLAASAAQEKEKTVWDGVYTDEQAKRGEAAYMQDCSGCHNTDLSGDGFAPSLTGTDFATAWSGTTVGDFYERIRVSMPPGGADSVSNAAKADIVAFILKYNRFPAGATELKDPADMKAIKIEAHKPGN